MLCDWLEKWIEFPFNNSVVRLQGIQSSQTAELQEIAAEQLLKWDKSNDLWAIVLLELSSNSSSLSESYLINGIPMQIKELIDSGL
jgi:hypothetical protein